MAFPFISMGNCVLGYKRGLGINSTCKSRRHCSSSIACRNISHETYWILFIYIWSCLPDKLKTVPHPFEVLPRCMEKSQITRTRLNWKSEFRFFFFLGHYNTDDVRSTGSNQRRRLLNISSTSTFGALAPKGPLPTSSAILDKHFVLFFLIVSNEPPWAIWKRFHPSPLQNCFQRTCGEAMCRCNDHFLTPILPRPPPKKLLFLLVMLFCIVCQFPRAKNEMTKKKKN